MDEHTSPPSACPTCHAPDLPARPSRRSRWIPVTLPLADFEAYTFGRRRPSAPSLARVSSRIGSMGVMLAAARAFSLRILSVTGSPGRMGNRSAWDRRAPRGRGHRARGTAVQSGRRGPLCRHLRPCSRPSCSLLPNSSRTTRRRSSWWRCRSRSARRRKRRAVAPGDRRGGLRLP